MSFFNAGVSIGSVNKILAYSRAGLGCLLVATNLWLSFPIVPKPLDIRQSLSGHLRVFGFGGFMYFFALHMPYYDPRFSFKAEPDFISGSEKSQRQLASFHTDLYPVFFYIADRPETYQRLFYPTFCRRLLRLWDAPMGSLLSVSMESVQLEWKNRHIQKTPRFQKDLITCRRE